MLIFEGSPGLQKIVVLNSKGGSGKTTLAFNLAGYLAATGRKVAIVDMDPQGSSMHWLRNRSSDLPKIAGVPAEVSYRDAAGDEYVVVPDDIDVIVVDAPAGVSGNRLGDYTCGAHAIFVPVLPSDLDIHAAARLVSDLLLKAQVSRRNRRLCVVPNRVRERTIAYRQLCRFLDSLSIAVVGKIRDSQNYVWAAKHGTCIYEMPTSRAGRDRVLWGDIAQWLERRLATPLNSRDMRRPTRAGRRRQRKWGSAFPWFSLAAGTALVAMSIGLIFSAIGARGTRVQSPDLPSILEPTVRATVTDIAEQRSAGETEALDRRWRLNGTMSWGDSGMLFVRDRVTDASILVRRDRDLHGWKISEIGADYAVFSRDEDRVRLDLQYDIPY